MYITPEMKEKVLAELEKEMPYLFAEKPKNRQEFLERRKQHEQNLRLSKYKTNDNMRYNQNGYHGNNSYKGYAKNQDYQGKGDFKKSASKYSTITKGKMSGGTHIHAWRKTKHGLMIASAFPVSAVVHASKTSGKTYLRYAVEIKNSSIGTCQTFWCLFCIETKKLVINELNLVISPNGSGRTASGKQVYGYFGTNVKR